MIDGIIKADGTSRLMRATLPETYEEFKAQAAAGTLPLDVLFNADGWSQLPTFLSKASLLRDATAALFGLKEDAVPDDALRVLSRFHSSLGNEYVWEKVRYEYTPMWGDASSQANLANNISHAITVSVTFYNDVVYESGTWVLANEYKTYSGITNGNIQSVLSMTVLQNMGVKYFADTNGKIYKTVPGTSWAGSSSGSTQWNAYIGSVCAFAGTNTETISSGYVNSSYADTYPPAVSDGYTYLGPWTVFGEQIAVGSYIGNNTATSYGATGNWQEIDVGFPPDAVLFVSKGVNIGNYAETWIITADVPGVSNGVISAEVTATGFRVREKRYENSAARPILNYSGNTYGFIAIKMP